MGERIDELFSAINAVSEDVSQLGKAISHALQQGDRTMDVLNIGGMNVDGQQETVGIGDDVPLASMNPFAPLKGTGPSTVHPKIGRAHKRSLATFCDP
jgi:hypothetical protein